MKTSKLLSPSSILLGALVAAMPLVAGAQTSSSSSSSDSTTSTNRYYTPPKDRANPNGPYVGAGWGQFNVGFHKLDDLNEAVQSVRDADDNAWKVFAGYRFLPWLGAEVAYIDFGRPSDRVSTGGTNGNYRVDLSGVAPSLIASVPLGPIELFAKAGEYYYDVKTRIDLDSPGPDINTSKSRNDFLWGGGISAVVLNHLELRAEYEKVEIKNASDSDAFWLSAAWRF